MNTVPLAAAEILDELTQRGVRLSAKGDRLRAEGKLTDDLKHRLREMKPAIMELVRNSPNYETVAVWQFSVLRVPSQINHGVVDLWVVGERLDKERPNFLTWNVRSEP